MARYGLRGTIVGEAAHPGPAALQRCRACLAVGVDAAALPGQEWCHTHCPPAAPRPGPEDGELAGDEPPRRRPPRASSAPQHSDAPPSQRRRIDENPGPDGDERVCCPMCSSGQPRRMAAVMTHISMGHAGEVFTDEVRQTLSSWGRAICCTEGCGAIRSTRQPICKRCRRSAPTRPVAVGDRVPPMRMAATDLAEPDADTVPAASAEHASAPIVPPLQPSLPSDAGRQLSLPDDFTNRVRALPPQTMPSIPFSVRARICDITAILVEGLNAGDDVSGQLEEGRSKLLLGHVPRGSSTAHELRTRCDLWEAHDFSALLGRIEDQHAQFAARRSGTPTISNPCGRVLRMARTGARRKAVQAMTSDTATFTAEEQRQWAAELLPRSESRSAPSLPSLPPADIAADALDGHEESPFKGVRFGLLSGPGPSGTRPEHIRDMLNCGRRRQSGRLSQAIRTTQALAAAGRLPRSWDWVLRTRLVFLKKRRGRKPRPVRVGEVWRRTISKRLLHKAAPTVRKAMLRSHQYAVSVPGGTEPLVHARRCFRKAVQQDSSLGVWAEVDVDVVNAFPTVDWPAIDAAMRAEVPELARWSEWCHGVAAPVVLPSGDEHTTHRGAEQGEPNGSLQCGAVIAGVRRRAADARATALNGGAANPGQRVGSGAFDAWFADDGQAFMRPQHVDLYLRTPDVQLAAVGCTRGTVPNAKSSVTLIGHPEALAQFYQGWVSEYVRSTCEIQSPNAPVEVLGTCIGADDDVVAHFNACAAKVQVLRDHLEDIGDPATELTLGRSCADVAKVSHLLRTSGRVLGASVVAMFDDHQHGFVSRILGGDLSEAALRQAEVSVRAGGLGMRSARDTAAVAFVASCTEAAPIVAYLLDGMESEGIPVAAARQIFNDELAEATACLMGALTPERAAKMHTCLDAGASFAKARFKEMLEGSEATQPEDREPNAIIRGGIVDEFGQDDPEHCASTSVPRLQRRMASIFDGERMAELARELEEEGRLHDQRRLQDLADESVSHEWLWSLHPRHHRTLEADVYVDAVRLRLGACNGPGQVRCRVCRRWVLPGGEHALCCAPGPSREGHDEVRDLLLVVAKQGDASAEKEAVGLLLAAPGRRPADIFTSEAGGNGLTVLDVGVASPDSMAAVAAGDALEAMRVRKLSEYAPFADAMREMDLQYVPIPWSCWGREHADTTKILTALCRRAARRRGLADWRAILRQLRGDICAALARRAARMMRQCFLAPAGEGQAEAAGI